MTLPPNLAVARIDIAYVGAGANQDATAVAAPGVARALRIWVVTFAWVLPGEAPANWRAVFRDPATARWGVSGANFASVREEFPGGWQLPANVALVIGMASAVNNVNPSASVAYTVEAV